MQNKDGRQKFTCMHACMAGACSDRANRIMHGLRLSRFVMAYSVTSF